MVEDLKSELTEAIKETSNTENLAVAEEWNVDEAINAKAKAINEMKMILKMKKIPNLMKSKWTLILKILTQLKIKTKYIQNNGGQSTKLYNHIFKVNWHLSGWFYKKM